jgi:hypothetical protein
MEYGFAIGGGSGGSSMDVVGAVVKSKGSEGDAVEVAVGVVVVVVVSVVVVVVVGVVVVVAVVVVVVAGPVVDVAVVVADAGAVVAGSCCDWVIKIRRGMMSGYSRR